MIFLASQLPLNPGIFESLRFQSLGLMIVLTTLGSLWLSVELLGYVCQKVESIKARRKQTTVASTGAAVAAASEDEEIAAVIAAAVATVIRRPHQITSVTPIATPPPSEFRYLMAWSHAGRTQIHSTRGRR